MKKAKEKNIDLIFTFEYVNVVCDVDENIYDETEAKEIKQIVKYAAKKIVLDKSYVVFDGNKHEDTFMVESGWNELCELVVNTDFGKKATRNQNCMMQEAFIMIILCYLYLFLENFGYTAEGIALMMSKKGGFMAKFEEDTVHEWKYYPGKWQTWEKYKKK